MSVPGVDRPEEGTEAEVTLSRRGISVSSRVESVHGDEVVVRPSGGEHVDQVVVAPGAAVEVIWKNVHGQRLLPAEVTAVETQERGVLWRLRSTGPAEHSQRRKAVRGRITVPVEAKYAEVTLAGETVDLSEGGLRANVEGSGEAPEAGARLDLVIQLEAGAVAAKGNVVRNQVRGAVWLISVQFVGIAERDQDRIRRRVFQELREERVRLARRAEHMPLGSAERPPSRGVRG